MVAHGKQEGVAILVSVYIYRGINQLNDQLTMNEI